MRLHINCSFYSSLSVTMGFDYGVMSDEEVIPRSYNKCNNRIHKNREEIEVDLVLNRIVKGYVRWTYHGECPSEQPYYNRKEPIKVVDDGPNDMFGMIHDLYQGENIYDSRDNELLDDDGDDFST
ncbi:hypothetical protein Dimus_003723 [Dionaea muscipula]